VKAGCSSRECAQGDDAGGRTATRCCEETDGIAHAARLERDEIHPSLSRNVNDRFHHAVVVSVNQVEGFFRLGD
jgi:hypothetical protein